MFGKAFLLVCCASLAWTVWRGSAAEADSGEGAANRDRKKRSDDFAATQVELSELAQKVAQQDSTIQAVKNEITHLQSSLQTAMTQVGFYAQARSSHIVLPSTGTLILDRVYANTGNAYDGHSGTFTAPLSGVYAFFLTVRSYHDALYVDITLNGSSQSRAYVTNATMTGFASVYLHLSKGNRVWVKSASSGTHDLWGSTYTHFTGFLVQADP